MAGMALPRCASTCMWASVVFLALPWQSIAVSDGNPEVEVSGNTGDGDIMNGVYHKIPDYSQNGYPCYLNLDVGQEEKDQVVMCVDTQGFWVIQPRAQAGTQNCWLHSSQLRTYSPFPWHAGPWMSWKVFHGKGEWTPNMNVRVAMRGNPEQPLVRKAVAVIIIGGMLCLTTLMCFAKSRDTQLRSQTWWLLSSTLTFAVSILVTGVVMDFTMMLIDPALGGDEEAHRQLRENVKTSVALFYFAVSYLMLTVVAWKLQDSDAYLMIVNSFFAHITALFGTRAVIGFYPIALETLSDEFLRMGSEQLSNAEFITGVVLIIVVWASLALFRWAAIGIRKDSFADPPVWKWADPKKIKKTVLETTRTCYPTACGGVSHAMKEVEEEVQAMDWKAFAADAEDEAASVIVGHLVTSVLYYRIANQLLGVLIKFGEHGRVPREKILKWTQQWWGVIGVLILFSLVVLAARASFPGIGHMVIRLQRMLFMAVMWSVFVGVRMVVDYHFWESGAMSEVGFAVMVSSIVFNILFVLDKILDHTVRKAGHNMAVVFNMMDTLSGKPGLGRSNLYEKAMVVITSGLGLVMGIAWSIALRDGSDVLIQKFAPYMEGAGLKGMRLVAQLLVALLLLWPFFSFVLPRARLSETQHEANIKREKESLMAFFEE